MSKSITLFINSLKSGGAEHQLSILANMLVNRGYAVDLVTISKSADHYELDPSVKRFRLGGDNSLSKIINIWRYFLSVKTDCVISFCQRNSFFALPPLFLRRKIKVICGERNLTVGSPDKIERILTAFLYKRADFVVPNSHSQELHLKQCSPKLSGKLHTIINYTDLKQYFYSPSPINEVTRIGVFCRLERQKNFHRFIDMLGVLKNNNVPAFHVDWYGNHTFKTDSQREYFETGLRMIQKYGVEDFITIHDPTREVAKLIPTFDAMCLPSLHEGFSNSISEYICCGRPVICSDVSDNSIMVHESENGFLFNPLDIDDMARAFTEYLKTTVEERCSMGLKSRNIAESLFDKEQFVKKYIELIES